MRRKAEPSRVDPFEQRLEVRQRRRVVAERQLEKAEHAEVEHACVLLLRRGRELRAGFRERARLVGLAEMRGDESLPVDGQAGVVLEADLLGELVLVGRVRRRRGPVARAEPHVHEAAGEQPSAAIPPTRRRGPPRAASRAARAPRRDAPGACGAARAPSAGSGSRAAPPRARSSATARGSRSLGSTPAQLLPEREPREDVHDQPPVARALRVIEREPAVLERGDHPAHRPGLAEQEMHAAAHDVVVARPPRCARSASASTASRSDPPPASRTRTSARSSPGGTSLSALA